MEAAWAAPSGLGNRRLPVAVGRRACATTRSRRQKNRSPRLAVCRRSPAPEQARCKHRAAGRGGRSPREGGLCLANPDGEYEPPRRSRSGHFVHGYRRGPRSQLPKWQVRRASHGRFPGPPGVENGRDEAKNRPAKSPRPTGRRPSGASHPDRRPRSCRLSAAGLFRWKSVFRDLEAASRGLGSVERRRLAGRPLAFRNLPPDKRSHSHIPEHFGTKRTREIQCFTAACVKLRGLKMGEDSGFPQGINPNGLELRQIARHTMDDGLNVLGLGYSLVQVALTARQDRGLRSG